MLKAHDVKYFGHVWFDSAIFQIDTQRIGSFVPDPNTINIIKGRFPGILLLADPPMPESFPEELKSASYKFDSRQTKSISNICSQLISIHRALNLDSFEDFDLVVLGRWDVFV